jgi:hypothetical protein
LHLLAYIDDCLLFAKTNDVLDSVLASLEKDFVLTSEGTVGAYLGIDIHRTTDGYLELIQPGLINKIISACGLQDQSAERLTISTTILTSAFAVHQCARFTTNPRRIHELAIRRIVRYLKGTSTKGIILKPSSLHNLDCFVVADFAGTWTISTSELPSSVKSRTSYVITFASCLVLWFSKLQSEVALSTTEAEYIALSQSTRDLIPMRGLLHELSAATKLIVGSTVTHSTVFEDNKGCVELATAPKIRPRTHHIALKYHHFHSHVENGNISILWIDTKHQLADIFTKPLAASSFIPLHQALLGW